MIDWTSSMKQTYEYYIVDPGTWKDIRLITTVKNCTLIKDLDTETLGSATIDITESIGEAYVRVYLVVEQNGEKEKRPLGTYLVQTPSTSYNGAVHNVSMDAYTPLLELKENQPPIGYAIQKNTNEPILDIAYRLANENVRAPVISASNGTKLSNDFVADPEDNWLSFINDLISNVKYKFDLNELGHILFSPIQNMASLQPVWTYNDDNSSILHPEISLDQDFYGIPNVVEVIYTNGSIQYYKKIENTDDSSPTSIKNRGRRIVRRITDPGFTGIPSETEVQQYAENLLQELSTIEYAISYTHGYCPVRVGDCVRLNYSRANLRDIKAKVIYQSIRCAPGCQVTEKAIFSKKLWR